MVLTRTPETASTGRFLTICFFGHFWGSESEPAEPEPAESGVVTEPLEPNRLDQEPTRTEPNRPFPVSSVVPFLPAWEPSRTDGGCGRLDATTAPARSLQYL